MDQELLGKLLIASPGLEDIRFQDSVILICEHSKNATMGLILNKPLYNFEESTGNKNIRNLASVDNNDEMKTKHYYYMTLQYMLRKSYEKVTDDMIKHLASPDIEKIDDMKLNLN